MKTILLSAVGTLFAGAGLVCLILLFPFLSDTQPLSPSSLVRVLLLMAGFFAGFSAALLLFRVLFRYRRRLREQSIFDLEDLTVKDGMLESLTGMLRRLATDLSALTRGEAVFLPMLEKMLQQARERKVGESSTVEMVEEDVCPKADTVGEGLRLVREMSRSLRSSRDINELYERAIKMAASVTHSARASIMLLDKEGGGLRLQTALGWVPDQDSKNRIFPLDEGMAGRVVRQGKRMLVSDIKAETGRDNREEYTSNSFIILPFFSGSGVTGVLNLTEREGSDLYEFDELELLNHLVEMLSLSLTHYGQSAQDG